MSWQNRVSASKMITKITEFDLDFFAIFSYIVTDLKMILFPNHLFFSIIFFNIIRLWEKRCLNYLKIEENSF
jgi:hypothetical protein